MWFQAQKDHYLNYRKIFHGENVDIFERHRKAAEKTKDSKLTSVGPTPFTGMSNAAAVAMASALNRTQQPTAPTGKFVPKGQWVDIDSQYLMSAVPTCKPDPESFSPMICQINGALTFFVYYFNCFFLG